MDKIINTIKQKYLITILFDINKGDKIHFCSLCK